MVPSHLEETLKSIAPGRCKDEQLEVEELLSKFADVFSRNEFDLGRTTIVAHEIDFGGAVLWNSMALYIGYIVDEILLGADILVMDESGPADMLLSRNLIIIRDVLI